MIIRKAVPSDIPAIISVLKASLGEDELEVSKEVWNFKHVNNPFGKSIVFVAEENEEIIGVRAFMRWNWGNEGKTYKACRAVDTATHPEHRGKGIFKRLTLNAVEAAREEGVNFIFNTPNEQSRPGYLKMGWETAGKIKVGAVPAWYSFWNFNKKDMKYDIVHKASQDHIQDLCNVWNFQKSNMGLFTPKTPLYLKWRYEDNPLQKYEIHSDVDLYIAASVKKRRNIKELRIVECIFNENKTVPSNVKRIINKWSRKFGVQVISFSPELVGLGGFVLKGEFGPILTVRDLNLRTSENYHIFNIENWVYSLGDLELF